MDPFFKAVGGAIAIIVSFAIAIIGGQMAAALAVKRKEQRKPIAVLIALAIFLVLLFVGRAVTKASAA